MNTRAAGRGTTTAGIAATTDAVTTVAAAGERGRQGTTRGVIYQPGSTLTKFGTFPKNRDHLRTHAGRSLPRGVGGVNTRAAGRGTTTAGIAATTDAVTTVAAAGERGRQGTTRGVIYQPGSTLTKFGTFPENRTTSVSRSLTGSSTGPVSSKRRKPSAHERTEHHVPPGDVDLPGLWTPAHRRAESGGRRGGRPQAVGNLAGERRRPCLRAGRRDSHSSTTHHHYR